MTRRRGTAIIETPRGILVASGRHKVFLLPGGTTNRRESRRHATVRELREETGLKAYYWKYLFTWVEPKDQKHRAIHKVFLIKAHGTPRPNYRDVHHIDYWKPSSNIKLSRQTKQIIDKYLREYKKFESKSSYKEDSFFDKMRSFFGMK